MFPVPFFLFLGFLVLKNNPPIPVTRFFIEKYFFHSLEEGNLI
jgi:hypothetical protein